MLKGERKWRDVLTFFPSVLLFVRCHFEGDGEGVDDRQNC
jgi:hypothetical protein